MGRDINQIRTEDGDDAARQAIERAQQRVREQREREAEAEAEAEAQRNDDVIPEMPEAMKAFFEQIPPPDDPASKDYDDPNRANPAGKKKGQPRENWRSDLLVTTTNTPKSLVANALIALRYAPEWQGVLAYDEFALVTKMMKPPPWLKSQDNYWQPTSWTDRDDVLTTDWLQHQGISVKTGVAAEAAETVARDAAFHPIQDYLNGLEWDGQNRIENFASTYLGTEAGTYQSAVSRCLFISGVARIMRPGCKADYVPILEGAQDKGKSTAIEMLFSPWFSDDLAELGSKDAAMQVRVAWGIEIGELASMSRADIDKVKAFITRKVDRFRPSYGRRVIEVPRQSIFLGSTNADTYLKDETGGRRFWPIRCDGKIDLDAIARDRDQFWAEAVALYKAGTRWWFTDGESITAAREQQAQRYIEDPWQEPIAEFLARQDSVSTGEVLMSLGIDKYKWSRADRMRVGACLKVLKWERYRARDGQGRAWRYRPAG